MNQTHQILVQEAEKYGWPEVFKDDLYKHDLNRLEAEDAPKQFGWVLRPCGTELLDLRMDHESIWGYLDHYRQNDQGYRYYIVNNGVLIPCASLRDWTVLMLEQYALIRRVPDARHKGYNRY